MGFVNLIYENARFANDFDILSISIQKMLFTFRALEGSGKIAPEKIRFCP
jgi:hypothetical protein